MRPLPPFAITVPSHLVRREQHKTLCALLEAIVVVHRATSWPSQQSTTTTREEATFSPYGDGKTANHAGCLPLFSPASQCYLTANEMIDLAILFHGHCQFLGSVRKYCLLFHLLISFQPCIRIRSCRDHPYVHEDNGFLWRRN